MNAPTAQYWIDTLALSPHPEGGNYREIFRSALTVQTGNSASAKSACTSIYYLLAAEDFSGFHRLASDELWYFHSGVPLLVHCLLPDGSIESLELSDRSEGSLCVAVKSGFWFAAEIPTKKDFTLVSCAVAPGFSFDEFEMADRTKLMQQFPIHSQLIGRLTR